MAHADLLGDIVCGIEQVVGIDCAPVEQQPVLDIAVKEFGDGAVLTASTADFNAFKISKENKEAAKAKELDFNIVSNTTCNPKPADKNDYCTTEISVLNKDSKDLELTKITDFPAEVSGLQLETLEKTTSSTDYNYCVLGAEKVRDLNCYKWEVRTQVTIGEAWQPATTVIVKSGETKKARINYVVPTGSSGKFSFGWQTKKAIILIDPTWNAPAGYTNYFVLDANFGTATPNFVFRISFDSKTQISNGFMRSDCNDFSVHDSNGEDLNIWWEKGATGNDCNQTDSNIWIKVPHPAIGQNQFRIYINNPTESTVRNKGWLTFPFFDDFNGVTLNTTIWSNVKGSWTVKDGNVSCANNGQQWLIGASQTFTFPYAARSKAVMTAPAGDTATGNGWLDNAVTVEMEHEAYGNASPKNVGGYDSGRWAGSYPQVSTYNIFEAKRIAAASQQYWINDGKLNASRTYNNSIALSAFIYAYGAPNLGVDWFLIRPLQPAGNEPDYNISAIQSASTSIAPDLNVLYPMNGQSFVVGTAIDLNFSIIDGDTNAFDMNLDINYSTSQTQGIGTVIVKDFNMAKLTCDSNNFVTTQTCKYHWDTTGASANNYYILAKVKDTNANIDFNAGTGTFTITSAGGTCTCPANGNWIITDGSTCVLSGTCSLGANKIELVNGTLYLLAGSRIQSTANTVISIYLPNGHIHDYGTKWR